MGNPVPLGDALSDLFALRGYGRIQAQRRLADIWQELTGTEISARTRVQGIRNGVLHIGVSHSALLGELVGFLKEDLLTRLRTNHPDLGIRDLRFRLDAGISRDSRNH